MSSELFDDQIQNQSNKNEFNEKCDIYSFGIVIYEFITRSIPFHNLNQFQIINSIKKGKRPEISNNLSIDQNLINLMKKCWNQNPSNRPNFESIIKIINDILNKLGDLNKSEIEILKIFLILLKK